MSSTSHRVIATRQLTYKVKGDSTLKDVTVCISEPYLVSESSVIASCILSFHGLPEREHEITGGDSLQALELAIGAVESNLRRFSKKYDFYLDGDPYFDD
ncbi:hypothetical protein DYGSA30_04190 [Dyella sp. GSA-30]|nr:hypothetical protein DYGSA30_04190 [Dyella sp. GSA-30]